MEVMEAKDYSFKYSGAEETAIEKINFKAHLGEIILVAGDSGSGKSTFLKSFNGLIPDMTEGEIKGERKIEGKEYLSLPIYEIGKNIGTVFQNPRSQFFTLDSTSEFVFAMENYGFTKAEMEETLKKIKSDLPIGNLFGRQIHTLSSGERQLLALACALTLDPKVLIFDEPSANLDYRNSMGFKKILERIKSNKTVFVADHRFFYLSGIIDRVFLIRNKTVEIFKSEEDFKNSDYNTRSFDLFKMNIPFKSPMERKKVVCEVKSVSKKPVLKSVSFSLYENETVSIVGVNGVGKTTIARLLTGSLKPDGGEIAISEMPFYVMQDADYQLFGSDVLNELEIGNNLSEESKLEVLESMDILRYKNTHPFDLSGGEKQRLQIAMAMISKSPLIILDEPTSGLDVKSMEKVAQKLEELSRSKSILIISHDYEFIRRVSNRILFVSGGVIKEDFLLDEAGIGKLNLVFKNMEAENENQT